MTSSRQAFSHYSEPRDVSSAPPPLLAWLAIGALILLTVVCWLGSASVLRQVFPLVSFVVGVFLYVRYPVLYIGYTWWIWFLIALIRRLIDFKSGWDEQGFILISPFLITLISFASFVKYLPKSYRMGGLPFIMAIFAVLYGFLVGLISFPPIVVFRTMLDWLTPVLFGFHIFVNWRLYPQYRQNIQTVFFWCVLLTGVYGIVQYLVAPEWDKLWLIKTKLVTMGEPEPFKIRVWSTMHSSAPFANAIMAGLLILLSSRHPMVFPASAAGYLSFLLTVVRSAWGGWVVGIVSLLTHLKPKLQMRLVVTMLVMVLCVVPLTTMEPFSEAISDRLESIQNLQNDQSYQDRSLNHDRNLNLALSSVLGNGIGGTWAVDKDGKLVMIVLDSGVLDTFFSLGWFGAIPYLGAIIMILYKIYQGAPIRNDSFANTARSISLAILFQMGFGSMMISLSGVIMWGFMGMAMAAQKYHQHELNTGIK